ncbi:MAG: hypothetical protein F9K31_01375 [Dokdonella sp.]|nr:MAG: hypothetical protein F9K31_01375 [Dokdonella sp.]
MDLSLKQRLLGAAVLIALAVIFVPMFLSGSGPRQPTSLETTPLAIPPAPDREFETRELDVTPPRPVAAAEPLATVDTATAPKPVDATPTGTAPAAPASATTAATVSPTPEAVAKPPVASTTRPAATAGEPAPTARPGAAAETRYFVHLGVYSSARNAADLVASLKKDGFAAYAEAVQYQGKSAERVRVGPFADRAAAEAARVRIKQARPSVPGSVVENAEDAKADTPATLAANRAGAYVVQLGAFKAAEDANKLRERLRGAGFAAFVDSVNADGVTLWRVRAGPEVDRPAAEKLRAGIKDRLKLDGMIVTQ